MRALFTRNSSPVSKLIRFLTGEQVSHCAVESSGIIYHSNFYGVHMETSRHFRAVNEVVYETEVSGSDALLITKFDAYEFTGYDFSGLAYLGLRSVFRFLPKANLWQQSGMFLCTEWVEEVTGQEHDASLTPYQLYQLLSNTKETK